MTKKTLFLCLTMSLAVGALLAGNVYCQKTKTAPLYRIINAHEHIQSIANVPKFLKANKANGIIRTLIVGSPEATLFKNRQGFENEEVNNEEILKIVRQYPKRFIAFPTIDPKDPEKLKKLKKYMSEGAGGLKLYSGHSLFYSTSLDESSMLPVYEYCEKNRIPILWHVNGALYNDQLENVLRKYPKLIVNIPHFYLSTIRLDRFEKLMDTYPNVYTDISFGYIDFLKAGLKRISKHPQKYRRVFLKYQDRIMYGTDSVITSAGYKTADWLSKNFRVYRDMLEKKEYGFFLMPGEKLKGLHLPPKVLKKIYMKNFKKWISKNDTPSLSLEKNEKPAVYKIQGTNMELKKLRTIRHPRIFWPKSVFFSPDGKKVLIHNLAGKNTMIINPVNFKIERIIEHGGRPVASAFTQEGRYLWVSLLCRSGKGYPKYLPEWTKEKGWDTDYRTPSVIEIYDMKNYKKVREIPVGIRPKVLAVSPDGKRVLVSNWSSNTVSLMDAKKMKKIADIPVGLSPRGICFIDNDTAYVANMRGDSLSVVDLASKKETRKIISGIGHGPRHLLLSPDHSKIYLSANQANAFQILDIATENIETTLPVGELPRTFALSPDGRFAFIVNYGSDSFSVIDLVKKKEILKVPTGKKPVGLAVSPDGKTCWITNYKGHSVQVFEILK